MNVIPALCKSVSAAARLLAIAICLASTGILLELPGVQASAALAKDGADDSGTKDDSSQGSGSGDDGSHGSGSHSGSSDHGSDDHGDEDHGGRDDSPDDHGSDGSTGSQANDQQTESSDSESTSGCGNSSVSLDLHYADGFHEHVSDCTYVLTDQHGRVVVSRSATDRDVERLQERAP